MATPPVEMVARPFMKVSNTRHDFHCYASNLTDDTPNDIVAKLMVGVNGDIGVQGKGCLDWNHCHWAYRLQERCSSRNSRMRALPRRSWMQII